MDKKNIDEMPKKSPLSLQIDLQKFEKATDEEKKQQDVMRHHVIMRLIFAMLAI